MIVIETSRHDKEKWMSKNLREFWYFYSARKENHSREGSYEAVQRSGEWEKVSHECPWSGYFKDGSYYYNFCNFCLILCLFLTLFANDGICRVQIGTMKTVSSLHS